MALVPFVGGAVVGLASPAWAPAADAGWFVLVAVYRQPYFGGMHAAIHPLTPGDPAYTLAKVSAIGGLAALRLALARRARRADDTNRDEVASPPPARPHPVSQRKARHRRKRR
jgi:hypothetical protein